MAVNLQHVDFESYLPQMQGCVNCYCGLCVAYCPALEETKSESLAARGLAQILDAVNKGEIPFDDIPDEVIYACTGCRWCEWNCSQNTPLFIQQHGDRTTKISGATFTEVMRAMRVEKGNVPTVVKDALDNLGKVGNPYGKSKGSKDKWVEGLGLNKTEDTVLYVGSGVPYEERSTRMAEALVEVLKKAGVKFSIIGGDESDSGALARYMGEEGLAEELVEQNAKLIKEKGIKRIIALSAHDYDAFVNYYGLDGVEVKHYTVTLLELIKDGKLKLSKRVNKRVTYHDACYLGRKNDIYEQPRDVLKSIPGLELVEMDRNRSMAFCCGGGGTGVWYELPRIHMNYTRVDQAKEVNPDYLAVACPVCLQMLDDGVKFRNYDIAVKDLAQIVLEAL
jgi:Fe-S oxidoreductase